MAHDGPGLQLLVDGVHVHRVPCRTLPGKTQTTMSVIDTGAGLLLYAPTPIDDALAAEIAALGQVRWIVAPNPFHNLYVAAACARYAEAEVFLAPGLVERNAACRDLPRTLAAPPAPAGLTPHLIPLRGGAAEVVLVSERHGVAFFADTLFNVQHVDSALTQLGFRIFGLYQRAGISLPMRMLIADRAAARAAFAAVADAGVTTLLPCHGEPVVDGVAEVLRGLVEAV